MTKILTFLSIFGLGALFGTTITGAGAEENATKPAYMIVSSQRLPGADYGPYSAAAGPLARDAGLQMIASSKEPVVLEGYWPYKNVTLEVYPSMEELEDFWYSDAYQAAKELREGLAEVNFIIAIEGD